MRRTPRSLSLVLFVWVLVVAVLAPAPTQATATPQTRLTEMDAVRGLLDAPFPFSHLAVKWHGSETATVQVRTGDVTGLGPWETMAVDHDSEDDTDLRRSGLIRADGATRLQARSQGDVRDLKLVLIDAVTDYLSPGRPDSARPALALGTPGWAGPDEPAVISRAAWGADESIRKGPAEFAPISKLVVHHTVTPNDDPDPASTVRAIYAYHTKSNGWNDIGYNFLVDSAGRVYEGRYARDYGPGEIPTGEDGSEQGVIGAHARGFNTGSAGVAMLGDFRDAEPSGAALDSLVHLLAWKAGRHGIDPEGADTFTAADGSTHTFPNITGHRDLGQTECPGGRLYDRLPEIRRRTGAQVHRVPAGPAPPPELPPPPPVPVPTPPGFWTVAADGRVRAFGDAPAAGDLGGRPLGGPIVSLSATRSGQGYWLAGEDGGVFAFGDAPFLGSAVGRLRSPAVQLEPTPSGNGYWVVTSAGEVVPFGDAAFLGGMAPLPSGPGPLVIAGMASTPTGQGYWLASGDGRVVPFGDAAASAGTAAAPATSGVRTATGVAGGVPAGVSIVGIAAHPGGQGYWLLGSDGGVFAFDAPFHGSGPGRHARMEAVSIRPTPSGDGYYVAGDDGAVLAFGDADARRERPAAPAEGGVVDLALHGR